MPNGLFEGAEQTVTLTGDVTGSGTTSVATTIANDAVTYAKIQNVSATDKILGRSTAGAGDVEEIPCTAAGRALLDDATAADQITTLGVLDAIFTTIARTTIWAWTTTVNSVACLLEVTSAGAWRLRATGASSRNSLEAYADGTLWRLRWGANDHVLIDSAVSGLNEAFAQTTIVSDGGATLSGWYADQDGLTFYGYAGGLENDLVTLDTAQTIAGQKTFECGAAGASPLRIKQTGGTDGVDELQFAHTGTAGYAKNKSGSFSFETPAGAAWTFTLDAGLYGSTYANTITVAPNDGRFGAGPNGTQDLAFYSTLAGSTPFVCVTSGGTFHWDIQYAENSSLRLSRPAAGVLRVASASNGGQIELADVADVGTPSANSIRIGSESGEAVVSDAAGNETIFSPHPFDAPDSLRDGQPGREKISRTINRVAGDVCWLNYVRLAKLCQLLAEHSDDPAIVALVSEGKHVCYQEEPLTSYVLRTGRQDKAPLSWQEFAEKQQATEDAERTAQLDALQLKAEADEAAYQQRLAAAEAKFAADTAAYVALSEDEREKAPAPVRAIVEEMPVSELGPVPVRAPRDVRKLPPTWLPKDRQPSIAWMESVGESIAAEMEKAAEKATEEAKKAKP